MIASPNPTPTDTDVRINPRLLRRFQPLEKPSAPRSQAERARVDLGRALFYDARLSKAGSVSCNSCHVLASYGVDHEPTSTGHAGQHGQRNAPTVYNASGFFVQFWDGRAPSVEEQAKGPILNPVEMAMGSAADVERTLRGIPEYVAAFRTAFPDAREPVTLDNTGQAIGAFERGLVTPSRWDDYLRGDTNALTNPEKKGLKTFLDSGCMVCHTGRYLGGSMFERVGAVEPWPNQTDQGRSVVTGRSEDAMMFKVPTLRNIAKTAPYFHDGSAATLGEAVGRMGRHQLGIELSPTEVGSIVTWLDSLTGELPIDYIASRELVSEAGAK
jgi:cytochrome c peroxidase